MADDQRMAWSGICDQCGAGHIVYATDEQSKEDQESTSNDWPETFATCMVEDCDGTVEFNGNDPIAMILHPRML